MAKSTPALSLSDFEAAEAAPGTRCWFEVKLNDQQRKAVTAAHKAGRTFSAISRVLETKLGVSVSQGQIRRHLVGECRCGK